MSGRPPQLTGPQTIELLRHAHGANLHTLPFVAPASRSSALDPQRAVGYKARVIAQRTIPAGGRLYLMQCGRFGKSPLYEYVKLVGNADEIAASTANPDPTFEGVFRQSSNSSSFTIHKNAPGTVAGHGSWVAVPAMAPRHGAPPGTPIAFTGGALMLEIALTEDQRVSVNHITDDNSPALISRANVAAYDSSLFVEHDGSRLERTDILAGNLFKDAAFFPRNVPLKTLMDQYNMPTTMAGAGTRHFVVPCAPMQTEWSAVGGSDFDCGASPVPYRAGVQTPPYASDAEGASRFLGMANSFTCIDNPGPGTVIVNIMGYYDYNIELGYAHPAHTLSSVLFPPTLEAAHHNGSPGTGRTLAEAHQQAVEASTKHAAKNGSSIADKLRTAFRAITQLPNLASGFVANNPKLMGAAMPFIANAARLGITAATTVAAGVGEAAAITAPFAPLLLL